MKITHCSYAIRIMVLLSVLSLATAAFAEDNSLEIKCLGPNGQAIKKRMVRMTIADIPELDKRLIREALRTEGRPVTDTTILERYLDVASRNGAMTKRGLDITIQDIPPADRDRIIQGLKARGIAEEEITPAMVLNAFLRAKRLEGKY